MNGILHLFLENIEQDTQKNIRIKSKNYKDQDQYIKVEGVNQEQIN